MPTNDCVKFNVLIPTRERADTLKHCLRTVVEQKYENLNIIVSDNFSQDDTKEVVSSFSDRRIKYINTGKRVSMSHNWEFALSHVTEGFVTYLGDDDGLLPGALQTVDRLLREYDVSALTSTFADYNWPCNGVTRFQKLTFKAGSKVTRQCSRTMLDQVLRGTRQYYELPWIYLGGFVSIHAINAAKKEGKFFLSRTPDVYSAVALSAVLDSYLRTDKTFVLNGISRHSTGAASIYNANNGESCKIFMTEDNLPFHPKLHWGNAKSIPLVVYEAYLQAEHLHNGCLATTLEEQLALALALAGGNYELVAEDCKNICDTNHIDMRLIQRRVSIIKAWILCYSILHRLWNFGSKKKHIDLDKFGVNNVYDASCLVSKVLSRDKCSPMETT